MLAFEKKMAILRNQKPNQKIMTNFDAIIGKYQSR